jgi:hypothetical protein
MCSTMIPAHDLGPAKADAAHGAALPADGRGLRPAPAALSRVRGGSLPDAATSDYDAVFVGLAYQNAHSAAWTSFADASIGWGELDATGADIDFHDLSLGVTYRPSREALYRLTLSWAARTPRPATRMNRAAPRLQPRFRRARHALSGPDWRAGAFASVDWRDITDTGVASDETVTAAGLSLRAYLNDDIYVETRGTHVTRDGATDRDETDRIDAAWAGVLRCAPARP